MYKGKDFHKNCNTNDHKKWSRRSFLQTLGLGGEGVVNHDYIFRENFDHIAIYDQERVSIRINNNFQDNYKISLYNIFGQHMDVLYDNVLEPGQYDISIADQLPQLSKGVYIYNINKSNKNYNKKIIIVS